MNVTVAGVFYNGNDIEIVVKRYKNVKNQSEALGVFLKYFKGTKHLGAYSSTEEKDEDIINVE